jgi:transposase
MSRLRLTPQQRARLEQQLKGTPDAGVFRRTWAVLEAAGGRPVAEIARLLRTSRASVHHWVAGYARSHNPACLLDHRGGNHPTLWTEGLQAILCASLAERPDRLGYQALAWTVPLLQEHLARLGGTRPSQTALRQQLHDLGYVWKRPRYALDPDPERGKKSPDPLGAGAAAAALRQAVRGRDGPAAVPAAAGRLGPTRPAAGGPAERAQRPAGGLRRA